MEDTCTSTVFATICQKQSQLRTSFSDQWTVIKCTVAMMHLDTQVTLLDRCCMTLGIQVSEIVWVWGGEIWLFLFLKRRQELR